MLAQQSVLLSLGPLTLLPPHQCCIVVLVVFPGIVKQFVDAALLERPLAIRLCQPCSVTCLPVPLLELTCKQVLYSLNIVEHSLLFVVPTPRRYSASNLLVRCFCLLSVPDGRRLGTHFRYTILESTCRNAWTRSAISSVCSLRSDEDGSLLTP